MRKQFVRAAVSVAVLIGPAVLISSGVPASAVTVPPGHVTEFATATGATKHTFGVPRLPHAMLVSPDGRFVYVITDNRGSDSVTRIRVSGGRGAVQSIRVNGEPLAIAMTPNGSRLYVSIAGGPVRATGQGHVAVFTTAPFRLIKSIPVNQPDQLAITPNGKTAYVVSATSLGAETITPIRTSTNTAAKAISVAGRTFRAAGIAVTANGRTVYVASQNLGAQHGNLGFPTIVTVVRTATNTVVKKLRLGLAGSALLAITPNGRTAYVSEDRGVIPISTATNTAGMPINAGPDPGFLVITPDSKTIYVANQAGPIVPISTATNTAGAPIDLPSPGADSNAGAMAISPTGTTVFIITVSTQDSSGVVIPITITSGTRTPGNPINVGPNPTRIALSPDGQLGFVLNNGLG